MLATKGEVYPREAPFKYSRELRLEKLTSEKTLRIGLFVSFEESKV
jgi:hypothetical protein